MIIAFSASLFLFSRAFLTHNHNLASLNLTKSHEPAHLDSTLNLSTAKPGVVHKVSLPMWDLVDSIKNETSDLPYILLESDSLRPAVTPSLAPVTSNNLRDLDFNRPFYSRFLSNTRAQLRPIIGSHSNKNGLREKNIDNIYHSETRHFLPGYDPLELEPFFSMDD